MDFSALYYMIEPYINTEYLILIPVLTILNKALCGTKCACTAPLVIVVSSVLISGAYAFSNCPMQTATQCFAAAYNSMTQGIIIAGLSLYGKNILSGMGKGLKTYYDTVQMRKTMNCANGTLPPCGGEVPGLPLQGACDSCKAKEVKTAKIKRVIRKPKRKKTSH